MWQTYCCYFLMKSHRLPLLPLQRYCITWLLLQSFVYARTLLDHAEPQIGSRWGLEHSRSFQFQLLIGSRLEKTQTLTQVDRDDAHMNFVNQPGSLPSLIASCAPYHHDIFLSFPGF